MSEQFILMLLWSGMGFILALITIYLIIKLVVNKAILKSSTLLQNKMASFRRDFPIVAGSNAGDILGQSLENLGLNGILNEFGINPDILNNPVVKGLISNYAPKIMEQISKQTTGKTTNINEYGL